LKTTIHRIAALALIALLLILAPAKTARASSPHDQALGTWADTCRLNWQYSALTITFGSDSNWATTTCDAIEQDQSNQYVYFPLTAPRPGDVQCAYIYTYSGYWLKEQYPYTAGYTGAVQIAVRDDLAYDDASLSQTACGSIQQAADNYNLNHGYNTSDNPLATVMECTACGGGGGGGSTIGALPQLPTAPKAKHPARKPAHCLSYYKGEPNPQHLPICKH